MKIAILGYGVEGKAVEKYFKAHEPKAELTIFDNFVVDELKNLSDFDLVFRTPSVNPEILRANNPGVKLTSVTEFFFDHIDRNHIIGITGTKGKGTTCSLTAALLESLGYKVFLVGNIGKPAIDVLDKIESQKDENYFIVYEMSSFQLWTLQKSPHTSVVLRISPDHLDVHKDFAEYVSAKTNIAKYQDETDSCIFYSENPDSRKIATASKGKLIPYPLDNPPKNLLDHLQIPGEHNRENAEAALLAVSAALKTPLTDLLKQHFNELAEALKNFKGLPHRIEFVREFNGIKYYDDNYSSALPAAEVAIKAFEDHPVVLIAGGKDRHLDLQNHKKAFFKSKNIIKVILIGETRYLLAKNQDPKKYEIAESLEDAVFRAKNVAEHFTPIVKAVKTEGVKGSTKPFTKRPIVLMSPGAASFDMFKNFNDRGEQFKKLVHDLTNVRVPSKPKHPFIFDTYEFNPDTFIADFRYIGPTDVPFCETVHFKKPENLPPLNDKKFAWLLDSALKLAFYVIGVSYYKANPTKTVQTFGLDEKQAKFFSTVYQDGLSQYAFTNHFTRADLPTFEPNTKEQLLALESFKSKDLKGADPKKLEGFSDSTLILQSGGKDSLLTATLEKDREHTFWYLSSSSEGKHPAFLKDLGAPCQIAIRQIDRENLRKAHGFNGHIPVTYITMSLGLIQAILNRQKTVFTSIGQEGNEAHATINDDFAVNHQWSKTYEAEGLFRDYVHTYISPELDVYSPIRKYTELKIAKLFAENCWDQFGHLFSSCNAINYKQNADNRELRWCGECSKCANTYLLFAPFIKREELDSLFGGKSLFENPKLVKDFKGLLGVGDEIKPFECVGEIAELRFAYHHRLPEYPSLPFDVPESDFDIDRPLETLKKPKKAPNHPQNSDKGAA